MNFFRKIKIKVDKRIRKVTKSDKEIKVPSTKEPDKKTSSEHKHDSFY